MTLLVQNDTGAIGSGNVFPLRAEADLFQICNMDMNLGETQLTVPADLVQVTYGTQTATGPCPSRIHLLVNTNFNVNPANLDIIVLALDNSFALSDGTMLSNFGGLTLQVGNPENPTPSVLVLYDSSQNGGAGYCAKGQVSGNYDLQTPNPVILYHELSHAFRDATHTSLSLAATGCAASPEEAAAETDENDMRTQLGLPLRDTTDHCGQACSGGAGPNTSSCCIIVSIATGSAYSSEVNALRLLRDTFLRASETGHSLFDHFFHDYYAFSPQVCRSMAASDDIRHLIEIYVVKPLTLSLGLIQGHTLGRLTPEELGAHFEEGIRASVDIQRLVADNVEDALQLLNDLRHGLTPLQIAGMGLDPQVIERISASPYVAWMILEPLEIYAAAVGRHRHAEPPTEIGRQLARAIDEWAARMPLTEIWGTLSEYTLVQELQFLRTTLLRDDGARTLFAQRLVDQVGKRERVFTILANAGFVTKENLDE